MKLKVTPWSEGLKKTFAACLRGHLQWDQGQLNSGSKLIYNFLSFFIVIQRHMALSKVVFRYFNIAGVGDGVLDELQTRQWWRAGQPPTVWWRGWGWDHKPTKLSADLQTKVRLRVCECLECIRYIPKLCRTATPYRTCPVTNHQTKCVPKVRRE